MWLEFADSVVDYDLQFLKELLELLDGKLGEIEEGAKGHPDPEAWGYYDRAEAACGLGFVACQQYLAATAGWGQMDKRDALALGPRHASGQTLVSLINHVANVWKHGDEYQSPGRTHRRMTETGKAIEVAGLDGGADYLMTTVLAELSPTKSMRFSTLLPLLEAWREDVRQQADANPSPSRGP